MYVCQTCETDFGKNQLCTSSRFKQSERYCLGDFRARGHVGKNIAFQMDGVLLRKVVKRVEFMSSLDVFAIFCIAFV